MGDVSAFEKVLDQAVGQKADVKSLVSKRSLEVRYLDETVTREEVVGALCIALGKPDLGDQCRLYKRFGGVQTAVVRLTEADVPSLLGLGKLSVGWWMYCRIREHVEVARCFRYQEYGHVSHGCTLPGRKDACWRCEGASHKAKECKALPRCLTCAKRGEKDVAHASGNGSCPIFREDVPEVEGRKVKFLHLNLRRGKEAQDLLMQTARGRGANVLLISEQHKWSENSAWYQDASRRAKILVCSPDLSIGDFLETDAWFVWVGDFNSKSPEWRKASLDRRGILVCPRGNNLE